MWSEEEKFIEHVMYELENVEFKSRKDKQQIKVIINEIKEYLKVEKEKAKNEKINKE